MSFSQPGNMHYQELPGPATTMVKEWVELENDINVRFADDNVRYAKNSVPKVGLRDHWNIRAWKGEADPVSGEFDEYWTTMITDFTEHLKEKGRFGKTAIAFDERPMESILAVISILKRIDPEWKIALAGDRSHPELELEIYDYSIASYLPFSEDIITGRKARDMPTTFYTACKERHLGPYTFAPPAENAWIGWYAAEMGYTGYLFWAYNCWVKDPLRDSRYIKWPSGTCYQFYPGPRTSIRFEKLIEGIQDFEKIRILRDQFVKNGEQKNIEKLNQTLSKFQIEKLESIPAADMLKSAKAVSLYFR